MPVSKPPQLYRGGVINNLLTQPRAPTAGADPSTLSATPGHITTQPVGQPQIQPAGPTMGAPKPPVAPKIQDPSQGQSTTASGVGINNGVGTGQVDPNAPPPATGAPKPTPAPAPAPAAPAAPAPAPAPAGAPPGYANAGQPGYANGSIQGEAAIQKWMSGQPMEPGLQQVVVDHAFNLNSGLDNGQINAYLAGGGAGYVPSSPQDFGWKWDGSNWQKPAGDTSGIQWNPQTQRFTLTGDISAVQVPGPGQPGATNTGAAANGQGQLPGMEGQQGGTGGIVNNAAGGQSAMAGGNGNGVTGGLGLDAPPTTEYNPQLAQVQSNQTVQGQLGDILKTGNPILEGAKARAMQAANARGLGNSSMAAQAGEEAVVNAAMPIAQQDAQTYQKQALANQDISNQFLSMKEGAVLDLQKAYEAFKQQNFMFDKDAALKRYINDSSNSTQEKVAAMQAASNKAATEASLTNAQLAADTQLKTAGLDAETRKTISQNGLDAQSAANLLQVRSNNFTHYVDAVQQIQLSQLEPEAKATQLKNLNAQYAGAPMPDTFKFQTDVFPTTTSTTTTGS